MANPDGKNRDASSQPTSSEASKNQEIDYEKRFKDTQGAFTKSQQENKALKARIEVLEKLTAPQVELDEATKTELENLKFSDPDAWRAKLNKLETEAQKKHKETLTEAERLAKQEAELENRARILAEFQKSHPNLIINDDVIKYDIPLRITNKLESGEISFEQFLNEVSDYLSQGKVIGDGNTTLKQPNLKDVGGGDTPTEGAVQKDIVKDYANIVF